MPRGVAIPEIRQQLFAAAERVIVRDGPGRLSGRAVTGEIGVATGLLYSHFADFDAFLAAYAVDRAFVVCAGAAALPERAGTGSVVGNLCDAVLSTPPVTVLALARLLVSRPELVGRVRAVLGEKTAGLDAIENAVAGYLAAEQRLGRVTAAADPEALALALVGVLHHVVLTADTGSDVHGRIRHTVTALVEDLATAAPRRPGVGARESG
ncbi:AcrR family transcriptional regulator [Saccharothrix tamanrassetensis]|uniref:AcrR family transcriptional regulator n=1 Tax=Saccharothrix tamanrassetensis TaxID=1051531 RepID=A0A841CNZ2_9PSEU|nr:TetR/AcrR family transcriptional regulator [Saccharothrix tamanrassetensis]MBB5958633.1 AcrR family transcriptional regulator [Saccharothrix tamanrassetensis]